MVPTGPKSLKDYQVIVTSYGTMTSGRGLGNKIKWRRIVLDEGHTIRNANTKAAEAEVQAGGPVEMGPVGDAHVCVFSWLLDEMLTPLL